MKRVIVDIIFAGLFLGIFTFTACIEEDPVLQEILVEELENETPVEIPAREAITFILGSDKKSNNPYYQEATNFYAFNPTGKTEHLVTSVASLLEISNYLKSHKPANGLPWGLVNLVSHGNQWTGLSVKVVPKSKRATVDRIQEYIDNQTLQPLPKEILDEESEIFIHGCGIGNNQKLMQTVAIAFGGQGHPFTVRASKLYEYYTSEQVGKAVKSSERYIANAYAISYKMGYQPANNSIIKELGATYPTASVNWQDALSRESPRWPGDTYHFTFQVPVKWVIPFTSKDSMPDVSTKKKQLAWIKTQPNILNKLKEIELPIDQFNWWFRQVHVKNEDGSKSPAIWLKGYATILSVLQALTQDNQNGLLPFQPPLDNEQYYTTIQPQKNS